MKAFISLLAVLIMSQNSIADQKCSSEVIDYFQAFIKNNVSYEFDSIEFERVLQSNEMYIGYNGDFTNYLPFPVFLYIGIGSQGFAGDAQFAITAKPDTCEIMVLNEFSYIPKL